MKSEKALLIVNVGTPDEPGVRSVRKYLRQFLNDKRVIDLPWLVRLILVNMMIIPFRVRRSTALYKDLWTAGGSPLLVYSNRLADKLSGRSQGEYHVRVAMRYGNPSMKEVMSDLVKEGISEIIMLPLYPQYADSTSGSAIEEGKRLAARFKVKLSVVRQFYDHPSFMSSFIKRISEFSPGSYDHILFSYHGLPLRQVRKAHPGIESESCNCMLEMPEHGEYCYRATCYRTTRLIAGTLGLSKGEYSTSFQSRLTRRWLRPFTDETIRKLAALGVKRLLVVAPSFVTDCLETSSELGKEYREIFLRAGGESYMLAESLNDMDEWAGAVQEIASGAIEC